MSRCYWANTSRLIVLSPLRMLYLGLAGPRGHGSRQLRILKASRVGCRWAVAARRRRSCRTAAGTLGRRPAAMYGIGVFSTW